MNPQVAYSWQQHAGSAAGYACLFTEEFMTQAFKTASVAGSSLFRASITQVLFPLPELVGRLSGLFEQLLEELQSSHMHKYDLVRNYLQLLIHESLKLAPVPEFHQPATSAAHLNARFLELLD